VYNLVPFMYCPTQFPELIQENKNTEREREKKKKKKKEEKRRSITDPRRSWKLNFNVYV
jgi:hypothetical protein